MKYTDDQIKSMFLDYFNNFLSVEYFAACYNLEASEALLIINKGRDLHELSVVAFNMNLLDKEVKLLDKEVKNAQ